MNKTSKTALITGASSGLGMELARLYAANGDNLVLVARSVSKMEELKAELEKAYGIQMMVIGKDLSQAEAPAEIYFEVKSPHFPMPSGMRQKARVSLSRRCCLVLLTVVSPAPVTCRIPSSLSTWFRPPSSPRQDSMA